MKRNVIINGLISGTIVTAFMMISMAICYSRGADGSMLIGYSSMILAFSMIFVAVKNQRDKNNGGVIKFGQAFQIGLYISLIASTMYVIGWAVEFNLFMPDFMDKYSAQMIEELQKKNLAPEKFQAEVDQMKTMGEMYKNPVFFALFTYLEIFPVGLIISIVAALILKKKEAVQVAS